MNIVQINSSYGNSDSTGRTTKELHLWLKQHNNQSTVYTTRTNDGQTDEDVFFYSSPTECRIHAGLSRICGLQGYFSQRDTKKLIQSIEKNKPHIVLLHVLHNNSINFPMLCKFLAKKDIPTVLVLHDCWYYTGHCCYYTEVKCDKWQYDCKNCPQIHAWNTSWWFDTAARCLKDKWDWFSKIPRLGVVGVSDWITNEAEKSILKKAKILRRIYNWIDIDVFKPQDVSSLRAELRLADIQQVLLGVASSWSAQKGLDEILMVAENNPEILIVLVGQTPNLMNWPSNILQVGTVSQPQRLARFYALADVFLNPSRQETFGKTTAEAICCGTPVVAYDTTACTELVKQGCGVLIKSGDVPKFNEGVLSVLKIGKKNYKKACLMFARENFSKEKNIKEYLKFMQELLA